MYVCQDCGNGLEGPAAPGTCPECSGLLRNTTNVERSGLKGFPDDPVEFPIAHDSQVGQLDGVEIAAPTGGPVPVDEVPNRVGGPSYEPNELLHTTPVGNLDDSFIGRKRSDDRGRTHTRPDPRCSQRQSL